MFTVYSPNLGILFLMCNVLHNKHTSNNLTVETHSFSTDVNKYTYLYDKDFARHPDKHHISDLLPIIFSDPDDF